MTSTVNRAATLPRLIDVEELFADPVFSGASISPDGTRIAYLAPKYGRTQVWVRGVDQEHEDAVCVTRDERRGIRTYHWTDDPRWLLYLQDTDGNEDWHLYRVDLDNPESPAVDLTPMEPGSRVGAVEKMKTAPGHVRVGMNKNPLYMESFKIEVATGETTLLQSNDSMLGSYAFGPHDEKFFIDLRPDGTYEFSEVDESGNRRIFHRQGGPEFPVGVLPMMIAPDGKGIYVGAYGDSDDLHLVRVDVTSGEQTVVAELPGSSICTMGLVAPTLPPSLFVSRRTGDVMAVRFVGDRPTILPIDPHFAEVIEQLSKLSDGVLASVSSDETEQRWVATFIHDREPGKAFFYDHSTGASRLLFQPYPQLDADELAPMKAVHLQARDGLPLHAFLTLPLGVEPTNLPLVLFVHGGPWCNDTWTYNPITQFFANRGYAVLQVNFRGSSGYGKRHITAGIRELAGKMHDDLIDAADWAVAQGIADQDRIGIYGGSYGGYSALVGVTFTPDYFAAAVDYVGISSLANFMRTLPEFVKPTMINNWYHYVGDPTDPDDLADMMARSPITHVDKIVTPLLVVQGANDVRVVKEEADNIVAGLKERGVPVEYIVAEDEGHGFQNPENNFTLYRAVERHFGAHLGGRTKEEV
jgi:dipeptidyl aminopeptidase/acylaminoacyl peptidase